ncbi:MULTISPECIES: hypothetical protein [unclassified Empedobacter]|uniref:hypothetical protein n=1 Tax=unclassified Empedobacter TaxID=2643773 RepID=UPI0025B8063E|nr:MULTISPECIES: hypothetical protein [unclassified Empedobacter]
MKLISMTDFVLEQTELLYEKNQSKLIHRVVNYAQFLKQPSKLGMFVPCDENNNPISKNIADDNYLGVHLYQQAKNRVLFEGFEIKVSNITNNLQNDFLIISETNEVIGHENKDQWFFNPYKKIEDLIDYDLTLTETAKKQIGL